MPFDPLPFFTKITEGKVTIDFRAGETIYRQASRAEAVHYLISGSIKEIVVSETTRREAIIGVLEPGDFFGTDGLEGDVMMSCGAVALTKSRVISIAVPVVMRELRAQPEFSHLFIGYLLERNKRIEAEKIDLLFNSTEKRLAHRLLMLAHYDHGGTETSRIIGAEITQEMLANMIGTTRPRVNFFMTKFRDLGLIRYKPNDSIEVTPRLYRVVLQEEAE